MLSPYHLTETDSFSYQFLTDQKIKYNIYFLDYSYMFSDYPLIAKNIYSFNVDVIGGDADFAKTDEKIGLTIVEIIKNFFCNRENVAVYVCDSADERHLARKRKLISGFGNITMEQFLKKMILPLLKVFKYLIH